MGSPSLVGMWSCSGKCCFSFPTARLRVIEEVGGKIRRRLICDGLRASREVRKVNRVADRVISGMPGSLLDGKDG
jgi:hypothetical protein